MIEALKQALHVMESVRVQVTSRERINKPYGEEWYDEAITSLRQAIAKAEDNYQGSDAAKAAHMMDLYEALGVRWGDNPFAVIAKMRSIAELESQEPVAWRWKTHNGYAYSEQHYEGEDGQPLYTHPPQRTWVGLTEDDKVLIKHDANFNQFMTAGEYADRVQQLTEARLKDKNT